MTLTNRPNNHAFFNALADQYEHTHDDLPMVQKPVPPQIQAQPLAQYRPSQYGEDVLGCQQAVGEYEIPAINFRVRQAT